MIKPVIIKYILQYRRCPVLKIIPVGSSTDRYNFDALRDYPAIPGCLFVKPESG